MTTSHRMILGSSEDMRELSDGEVDLIVTSPPYPMIELWDELYSAADPGIASKIREEDGVAAFDRMHEILDRVWTECRRVLKPGGFLCINIGDATRSVGGEFRLYPNQARITEFCERLGFQSLPKVIWRKSTNAPNKFMGSGMLPGGAYVTLEHEYVLILRNGPRTRISTERATRRRKSAYFWEERNVWFSDLWTIAPTRQKIDVSRRRSGAFPTELAKRLVHMYSVYGDLVIDPFAGTGTVGSACVLTGRNSVGFEIVEELLPLFSHSMERSFADAGDFVAKRVREHLRFVELRSKERPIRYTNKRHGFGVVTSQETDLELLMASDMIQDSAREFRFGHTLYDLSATRPA